MTSAAARAQQRGKKLVTVELPLELYQHALKVAELEYRTFPQLVRKALADYMGVTPSGLIPDE